MRSLVSRREASIWEKEFRNTLRNSRIQVLKTNFSKDEDNIISIDLKNVSAF